MKHSVELIALKNGAEGLLIDVPNASVMNTKVQFRAGMRCAKSPDIYEIAHVVEHLSFGAKTNRLRRLSSLKMVPTTTPGLRIIPFAMKPNVLILSGNAS